MSLGRQLRILRLQGTKRQQCGPIQTQLPDWLDRDWGRIILRRGCLHLGLIKQTHLKLKERTNTCTHGIFFKEHWGGGKKKHRMLLNVILSDTVAAASLYIPLIRKY